MTTSVTSHATAATNEAKMAPKKPAPSARRKAMKARAQATGCRIMARVRAFVESVADLSKVVWSMPLMISAGL